MPNIFGDQYSATDNLKRADGRGNDAGVRCFENSVDLAVEGGGTTNPLQVKVPAGCVFDSVEVGCTVNNSAITVQVGIAGTLAKYAAATAGPAANTSVVILGKPDMKRSSQATTTQETVILTPSAAWSATGILTFLFYARKR